MKTKELEGRKVSKLIKRTWTPDNGFSGCCGRSRISRSRPSRPPNLFLRKYVEHGHLRLYIVIGVLAVLFAMTNGSPISAAEKDDWAFNAQVEDDSPIALFHHPGRARRSIAEHHHNHHSRAHHSRHRKQPSTTGTQCPPHMDRLPDNVCAEQPCLSHSDCSVEGQRCCYNGCIFSCAPVVRPPPLIDWQTRQSDKDGVYIESDDFPSDEYAGNLEFDIVPGEMLAEAHRGAPIGELCSTTVEEGDIPLDCPHGYICHVENVGDPKHGLPDRGRCVAIVEDVLDRIHDDDTYLF